jgi:membrane-associated protease RseP (regulator of RpoE activity)
MEPLAYVLGVLAAIIGIGLSIGLHEVGHLVPAKRFGVKVTQYMVGFGPTVWSRRRGETEYGIKAIPLGGYVRMIGMYLPPRGAPPGTAGRGTTGRLQVLAEEARQMAWEEVAPGDEQRLFYRLSAPRKIVVMMGGPLMNLALATIAFAVLLVAIGVPTLTTRVGQVIDCVPPSMTSQAAARAALADPASASQGCPADAQASPAARAGILPGERIVAIEGQQIDDWAQITPVTSDRAGLPTTVRLESGGQVRAVQVSPAPVYRPEVGADGQPTGEVTAGGYLGVSPEVDHVAQPLSAVPATMWDLSVRSAQALLSLPVRVYDLARDMVTGQERDLDSPVSVVGIGRLSGEIAAAEDPLVDKGGTLLSLFAGLNLFLFLFNLVPLLPLDGGHVAGALWEGTRRQVARLRGRPDPGPVDMSKALPVTYAVGIALIGLSSVVILADVLNPISLFS